MKDKKFDELKEELLSVLERVYLLGKLAGMEEIQKVIKGDK